MALDETLGDAVARILARCERQGDCMVWPGATTQQGRYPVAALRGKSALAHRLVLMHTQGLPPAPDMEARHIPRVCTRADIAGDGLCCNPQHLAWGTPLDNAADKAQTRQARLEHAGQGSLPLGGRRA